MKAKRICAYTLGVVISIALFVVVILTCFEWGAFNESAYERAQIDYKIADTTGISQQELGVITHRLLEYCKGNIDSLNMKATVHGAYREVFDEREKSHMVDVQKLFLAGYNIRSGCLLAALLLTTILVSVVRRDIFRMLPRSWLWTLAVLGAIGVALGIYIMADFQEAFYRFHLLFFNNDLWQLDADTEVLIQMLPEQFFFSLVRTIVTSAAVTLAFVTGVAAYVLFLFRRRSKAKPDHVSR